MKKKYNILVINVALCAICGIPILLYYNIGIPCVFNKITGLYCPGCGITRAIKALIRLDFYQAFRYNPVIPVVLALLIGDKIYRVIRKKEKTFSNWFWITILLVVLIFGVLRNIPMFSYLAPTQIS